MMAKTVIIFGRTRSTAPDTADWHFFWGAVSINYREKVQSLHANSGLYAVRS